MCARVRACVCVALRRSLSQYPHIHLHVHTLPARTNTHAVMYRVSNSLAQDKSERSLLAALFQLTCFGEEIALFKTKLGQKKSNEKKERQREIFQYMFAAV